MQTRLNLLMTLGLIVAAAMTMSPSAEAVNIQHSVRPNIYKGALNMAGSLTLGSDEFGNSYTQVSPMATYFIMPQLAVGASVEINSYSGTSNYTLGPIADYYFFHRDRLAASGGAGLFFYNNTHTGSGQYYIGQVNAKFDYFLTPSVAFGPGFFFNLPFSAPSGVKSNYKLTGIFSFFF
jgi:hypothetical protein